MGQISGIINHATPKLTTFPPPVVGRICSEYKEQTQYNTQQRMHRDRTVKFRFMKVKEIKYEITYCPGIERHENQNWAQRAHDMTAIVMSK